MRIVAAFGVLLVLVTSCSSARNPAGGRRRAAGRLAARAGEDYALDEQVPDAGVLVIALRTTAREHVAKIVLPNQEDSGARGDAAAFAESLRPSRWAGSDFTGPPAPYRPGRVAVTYDVVTSATEPARGWPLPGPVEPRCVVLTGTAATRAQELGEREPLSTLWEHGDVTFHTWVRPLLPDEADCRATERRHAG